MSAVAFNSGKPLRAVELQRAVYEQVKGQLSSQMTITALRVVAGAYASAKRNYVRRVRMEARREADARRAVRQRGGRTGRIRSSR
ncbi:MAG TPA: hypothetical protein VGS80_09580 [Ktedonobacterales bacterium]|nr:hypothetical protein [Ktedonobacterales bacterium]